MILRTWLISAAVCIAASVSAGSNALSRDIQVAKTGNDTGPGTRARPYLTIGKAAAQGYESDYNAFLEGAKKSSFGDHNSVIDPLADLDRGKNTIAWSLRKQ